MSSYDLDRDDLAPDELREEAELRRHGKFAIMMMIFVLSLAALGAYLLDTTPRITPNSPEECAAISDPDVRLSCYDSAVHRAPSQPARGATAPSSKEF